MILMSAPWPHSTRCSRIERTSGRNSLSTLGSQDGCWLQALPYRRFASCHRCM